ncbi:A/G-specific adenine glycosylase [soil metagenome]
MTPQEFRHQLHNWYQLNKRDLPWRNTLDPYQIWLSEIILQQTRVNQGLPYFHKFISKFPDIRTLAAASEQDVLKIWQGLGYYTRARNLHACAREIIEKFNGKFPSNYQDLLKLKGVGEYTAAAIASFAFKEPIAVLDGNVFRVLSRVFGIEAEIKSNSGKKLFTKIASELLDTLYPDNYNQAIMEFGALQCTPVNPDCNSCAFSSSCFAYKNDLQKLLPVKAKKIKVKKRFFNYFIIEFNGSYVLKQRFNRDIWKGLYDFYLIEDTHKENIAELNDPLVQKISGAENLWWEDLKIYYHKLTHQELYLKFYHINIKDKKIMKEIIKLPNFALYSEEEVNGLPKPILIHNYWIGKLNSLN